MELVDFLRARLDEEQAEAEKLIDVDDYSLEPWAIQWEETGEWNSYSYLRIAKARVLAEVEAKRRSIARIEYHADLMGRDEIHGDLLRLLALPYADHSDYRQDWKP